MSFHPKVVVIGSGFAGLECVKALRDMPMSITLIDKANYHCFQPLLYQVATAGLAPSDIAVPIREIVGRQLNLRVVLGEVDKIDARAQVVSIGEQKFSYDYLVIAAGARHAYFGHDEWAEYAPGLKSVEEATEIRRRILLAFERAEMSNDPLERKAAMTFVIVGGGPTGVEMAGAIVELARVTIAEEFRNIDPRQSKIILIEAGPRLLSNFPEKLSNEALKKLEQLGVQVRLNERVTNIDAAKVSLASEEIYCQTKIWAAGVQASGLGQMVGAQTDRQGRVEVASDLSVPVHPNVFVAGDMAQIKTVDGKSVPGVAPAAMQQGRFVAKAILASIAGKPRTAFKYADKGNLATIGRAAAVADFGKFTLTGFAAWLMWLLVHIFFLIGFRNRFVVVFQWAWAYFTYQKSSRLIMQKTP